MLAKLHTSLQNVDLGQEQANVLVRTLLDKASDIQKRAEDGNLTWFEEMKNVLSMADAMEEGSKNVKAFALAVVKRYWENLPITLRKEYDMSFDVFTIREAKIQPTTAGNYIRAAETFLLGGAAPKLSVQIPEREKSGKVVVQDGSPVMKTVQFDPTRVSISKLTLMTHVAKAGLMEPGEKYEGGWAMLMDNDVTTTNIQTFLYNGNGNGNGGVDSDPSLTYTLEGDLILAKEFGEMVEIGELFSEVAGRSELGARVYRDILRRLGIKYDEDDLAKRLVEAGKQSLMRVYMNGGAKLVEE